MNGGGVYQRCGYKQFSDSVPCTVLQPDDLRAVAHLYGGKPRLAISNCPQFDTIDGPPGIRSTSFKCVCGYARADLR